MSPVPLAALGDSLTQGFMSAAISRSDLSYPSLISQALGILDFRTPDFSPGGGFPLNLENLLRTLSESLGPRIPWWKVPSALWKIRRMMDKGEDYWERGPGNEPIPGGLPFHNLGAWGFRLQDTLNITASTWDERKSTRDNFLNQIPNQPIYRSARRVLQPSNLPPILSQWDSLGILAAPRGLDNLLLMVGANNILGTVVDLAIRETTTEELDLLPHERRDNLSTPTQFAETYKALTQQVIKIAPHRVFVGNIPHVTIPPLTRGTGSQDAQGYYEYYTRPWIWDDVFDPLRHPHLSRQDVKKIDHHVDEYNLTIRKTAEAQGWHLVDVAGLLDSLAFRRNFGQPSFQWPEGLTLALEANPVACHLVAAGKPTLDTRFISSREGKLVKGGLFSLDGVHPTTVCYGLIAQCFLDVMTSSGVRTLQGGNPSLNWNEILAQDTLICQPPSMVDNLQETLHFLAGNKILQPLLSLAGGKVL